MKVIAMINGDKALIEATRDDFEVGAELKIHIMYEQAKYILDNLKKIKTVIEGLENVIKNLTIIKPFTAPEVKDKEE